MWTRVGAAAACFAAIMGFSRLAYGVLVPAMRASLGGSFGVYGAIGAANMVGYLAGALLATRLARRPDRSRVNAASLLGMCAAVAACAFVREPILLGALRFLVGATSGVALALTLALAVEAIPAARRGIAASIVWGGGTVGIALVGAASGFASPALPNAWRFEWFGMGVLGIVAAVAFARLTGGSFGAAEQRDSGGAVGLFARGRYRALTIAYFAFGVGYIDVVTFFGAALARAHGLPIGAAWALLGTSGIAGVVVWGPLVDRLRSGVPVALACACCASGAALVAVGTPLAAFAGAVAIGISFIGIPAMVGALLQQREPATRYPRAFASMTVALGIGQIIGPLLGGFVADRFGTAAAVAAGAIALALAACSAAWYRRPHEEPVRSAAVNRTLQTAPL
jgi:predicted MFS family arabinose efflux permease